MKYFSMFSGIGGFDLALNRLGHECVGYSEIDKYAIQVYKYRFGEEVKNFGDATKINPDDLPGFDILCGGFPCQSWSVAGSRKGFEESRGTLFFEISRIAQAKRPRYLFLENVKGLLNHSDGDAFARILLAVRELGYDVEYELVNSRYFGVPQNRERVFIIGCLRGEPRPKVFPLRREVSETDEQVVSTTLDANLTQNTGSESERNGQKLIFPCLTPDRLEKRQNGRRFKEDGEPMFTLNAQDQHGILQLNNPAHSNDRVYSEEGISPTLNPMQGGMRQPFICYSLQERSADRPSLKDNPNAGGSGTLTRDDGQTYCLDAGCTVTNADGARIRRLTPLECERLQGFPDGWTEYGINENGEKVKISDNQRYKMCGNAVTVNVIEEIAKRLT